jgi:hypothetical protein
MSNLFVLSGNESSLMQRISLAPPGIRDRTLRAFMSVSKPKNLKCIFALALPLTGVMLAGCATQQAPTAFNDHAPSTRIAALPDQRLIRQSTAAISAPTISPDEWAFARNDARLGSAPVALPREAFDILYRDRPRTSNGRPIDSFWMSVTTRRSGFR